MSTAELVLPSGRFATIRHATVIDLIAAWDENPVAMQTKLAASLTLIDGEKLSAHQWATMDLDEFMPVLLYVGEHLREILQHTKGIA